MSGMKPDAEALNAKALDPPLTCTSIEWFHEGQTRVVEANGVRVAVRYVGGRGRRGRIAIEAPAGATISSVDLGVPEQSSHKT